MRTCSARPHQKRVLRTHTHAHFQSTFCTRVHKNRCTRTCACTGLPAADGLSTLSQDRDSTTLHMEKSVHNTVNHCNQVCSYSTVFFTFDCCSKCSGITVNLNYSGLLYHLHFCIVHTMYGKYLSIV